MPETRDGASITGAIKELISRIKESKFYLLLL